MLMHGEFSEFKACLYKADWLILCSCSCLTRPEDQLHLKTVKLLQDATKLPPDTLSKGNTVRSGEVLFQAGGISLRDERTTYSLAVL